MTRLILIRHGQTDFNLERRYCGFCNPPLNGIGVSQAKKLANRLRKLKIDKVYSSDLKRAYMTAEIIFKNRLIEKLSDFREMNFGVFEGLRYEEIVEKYPELYKVWINNPMETKLPHGEELKDLNKRVKERLSDILSKNKEKTIALVTHGGHIRVILCDALKYDLKMFWQIRQELGALNIIDYPEEKEPIVIKMNDTSHLSNQEAVAL